MISLIEGLSHGYSLAFKHEKPQPTGVVNAFCMAAVVEVKKSVFFEGKNQFGRSELQTVLLRPKLFAGTGFAFTIRLPGKARFRRRRELRCRRQPVSPPVKLPSS